MKLFVSVSRYSQKRSAEEKEINKRVLPFWTYTVPDVIRSLKGVNQSLAACGWVDVPLKLGPSSRSVTVYGFHRAVPTRA